MNNKSSNINICYLVVTCFLCFYIWCFHASRMFPLCSYYNAIWFHMIT